MQSPAGFLHAMESHLRLASGAVSPPQTKKQPCAVATAVLVSKGSMKRVGSQVPMKTLLFLDSKWLVK